MKRYLEYLKSALYIVAGLGLLWVASWVVSLANALFQLPLTIGLWLVEIAVLCAGAYYSVRFVKSKVAKKFQYGDPKELEIPTPPWQYP